MAWRNGPAEFGLVSRALHWLMAAAVLVMLALGSYLVRMEPGLANLWLFGLHKTIGIGLLVLVLLRLIWHRFSPPPLPLGPTAAWETRLARLAHGGFYVLLVIIPLSGWSASSATGIDAMIFDRWTLPPPRPGVGGLGAGGFRGPRHRHQGADGGAGAACGGGPVAGAGGGWHPAADGPRAGLIQPG